MADEYIMTVEDVKNKEIRDLLEYDFFTNKPVVADEVFDTEEEAIEYEFKIDECYDPIRHLPLTAKVVMYWDEDDILSFRPL